MAKSPRALLDEVVEQVHSLPEDQLPRVLEFLGHLKRWREHPQPGSPAALLELAGAWEGPPGELEGLVEEIYEARHQEA